VKPNCESDTHALIHRISANQNAQHSLEDWIFQRVTIEAHMDVLDLGCGTGKQLFALQKLVSPNSKLTGVDVSVDAVRAVTEHAERHGVENVEASMCPLDDVVAHFEGRRFDLILSTYAVYYSSDMKSLLASLSGLLSERGQVFVCGYGKDTNREFDGLLERISGDTGQHMPVGDFISAAAIAEVAQHYSSHTVTRLANSVEFSTLDALMSWWTNHGSYVPELHEQARASLVEHFDRNQSFQLTKNVLGVRYDY
jgi:ubiquinone/menaquinone biosynthesis C-methylase UbiE